MIEYRKAQKILLNSKIIIHNEIIFAKNSLNRVSAKNIFSPTNYPAGNNTAFDGYAINSKETSRASSKNIKKFLQGTDVLYHLAAEIDDEKLILSASIGIAIAPTDSCNPKMLIKYADSAMYEVKSSGKNSNKFFTKGNVITGDFSDKKM